jgi:hypothetical protein
MGRQTCALGADQLREAEGLPAKEPKTPKKRMSGKERYSAEKSREDEKKGIPISKRSRRDSSIAAVPTDETALQCHGAHSRCETAPAPVLSCWFSRVQLLAMARQTSFLKTPIVSIDLSIFFPFDAVHLRTCDAPLGHAAEQTR